MNKIKIAIEGGAGYTAGELIRILLYHPNAELKYINSESHKGKPITLVHKDLIGDTDTCFNTVNLNDVDVVFLCKGHGKSAEYISSTDIPGNVKVIDLSEDFRDEKDGFVYGLSELNADRIKLATKLANPGCFATGIQLAILPLAASNLLYDDIHITSITGSTGAGQSLSETSHFSWRNNNISVYKPFQHQHLKEINRNITALQPNYRKIVNMVPIRGNFSRGILSSIYTKCHINANLAKSIYREFYANQPFVKLVDDMPDLKQVVNTNKCLLYVDKLDDKIFIVSVIDNLLKGASGQAVQNMNLMFGLNQTIGLALKPVAF